ncbi:MAG: peptidoglycan bridge formation glycyltransferase FemA/FemB family protein [bacterium]|nr:peptidoglycan bridge formation glycyltransferase FemA/FemB family protein [bacterium]
MENLQKTEIKINIVPFENAEEWDRLLFGMPDFHYLQTKEWGDFKARKGWKPLRYAIKGADGETIGAMQLLKRKTVLGKNILYCPKGPSIKKPFSESAPFWKEFKRELEKIAGANNAFLVKLEPQTSPGEFFQDGFLKKRSVQMTDCTIINNLDASEEELFGKIKKNARYEIRAAEKSGVMVVEDSSTAGIKEFLKLYYDMGKRTGIFLRNERYMLELMNHFVGEGRAKVFLAKRGEKVLSGAVVFIFQEKAWYAYGGSARNDDKITASYLLQFEIMKRLKRLGVGRYDLGGTPCEKDALGQKNMAGLKIFKSRFGGEYKEFAGSFDMPVKKFYYEVWLKLEPFVKKYRKLFKKDLFY